MVKGCHTDKSCYIVTFCLGDHVLQNGNVNGLLVGEDHKGGEGVAKSSTAWHNTRKLVYVKTRTGFWPIPESFWPDTHTGTLVGHAMIIWTPLGVLPSSDM